VLWSRGEAEEAYLSLELLEVLLLLDLVLLNLLLGLVS
jgi:hypothetical protein